MKKNRIWALGAALIMMTVMFFSVSAVYAAEGDVVVYDAADFAGLSSRTQQEIMNKYTAGRAEGETYVPGRSATYYEEPASLTAPYSAGVLSADTLKAMKGMSNFYRWLIGVNDMETNLTSDHAMQAQALDRNFEFDHYISNSSKPADMDDDLWAEGYACTHNILSSGSNPSGSIANWLDEGYDFRNQKWDTVGHRTAILNAGYKNIIYGYCGRIGIGKCGSKGNPFPNAFAAFPAAGYMPSELLDAYYSSWTVELNPSYVSAANASNVVITVENLKSGESFTRTQENGLAKISSSLLNFVQPGDMPGYEYEDPYKVTVTGLEDASTGKEASITYTVKFFHIQEMNSISMGSTRYAYTGEPVTPEFSVNGSGGAALTEGTDYTVNFYHNVEIGTGIIEVRGIGNYCGVMKTTFTIEEDQKDMSQCTISLSPSYYSYNGSERKPEVTVDSFGKILEEGKDYTVSYSDNVSAGTGKVTVRGTGEYSGTVEKTFTIAKGWQYISANVDYSEIETGGTAVITASAYENPQFTFTSSDEAVATVDADGKIHGISDGTATITITAAETANYRSNSTTLQVQVSKDFHMMEEVNVIPATETNEMATVVSRCSVCGKEETRSFKTMSSFSLWYWTGSQGSSWVSREQKEGNSLDVSMRSYSPSDAEDTAYILESSDSDIMKVDGNDFWFVGAGDVTLTIYAKYRPSVRITIPFTVSHVLDEGTIVKVSTCAEKGQKRYTCSVCGETVIEELPLDPGNHTGETYLKGQKEETCGEDGYTGDECCKGCDAVLQKGKVTPATGNHSYGEGRITVEPTCKDEGLRTFTCAVCGDSYTEKIPVTSEHKWSTEYTVDQEPTCQKEGSKSIYCSVCGIKEEGSDRPIAKIPHSHDQAVVSEEPTLDAEGLMTYICSMCGDSYSVTIPRLTEEMAAAAEAVAGAEGAVDQAVTKAETITENSSRADMDAARAQLEDAIAKAEAAEAAAEEALQKAIDQQQGDEAIAYAQSKRDAVKDAKARAVSAEAAVKEAIAKAEKKAEEEKAAAEKAAAEKARQAQKEKVDLPQVKISKAKAAKKAMTVKWKKVSKANQKKIASIQIRYSLDKKFKTGVKIVTAKKSAASKKIKKLQSKKKYYVQVRAYKKVGKVVHVSKWSKVKSVKIK